MGFRLPGIKKASLNQASSKTVDVPKGYLPVYQTSFQDMLSLSDEEFGYKRPMGGLMIPCGENVFLDITSRSLELIGSNPTMIRLT
ncbi:hypothetical protein JHK82_032701 [Glycine max]|nr:hypothetical protein JHK82_032701 [Glycine max]